MAYWTMFNLYQQPGLMLLGLLVIVMWVVIWKGLGLWFSAQNKQKNWFIAMLILNTLGLLPIIYLIWFKPRDEIIDKEKMKSQSESSKRIVAKKKTVKKVVKKREYKK